MDTHRTLPIIRIAGNSRTVPREHAHQTAQTLHQQWLREPPAVSAFSPTLYAVYQYPDPQNCRITFGKLLTSDAPLPDGLHEVWVAPQNYAVFPIPNPDDLNRVWAQVQQQSGSLKRRFLADLLIYPASGSGSLYVGVEGDVVITEE